MAIYADDTEVLALHINPYTASRYLQDTLIRSMADNSRLMNQNPYTSPSQCANDHVYQLQVIISNFHKLMVSNIWELTWINHPM